MCAEKVLAPLPKLVQTQEKGRDTRREKCPKWLGDNFWIPRPSRMSNLQGYCNEHFWPHPMQVSLGEFFDCHDQVKRVAFTATIRPHCASRLKILRFQNFAKSSRAMQGYSNLQNFANFENFGFESNMSCQFCRDTGTAAHLCFWHHTHNTSIECCVLRRPSSLK